jgi:hypothetical protein
VKLLDCPGIVFASGDMSDGSIALKNALRLDHLQDVFGPATAILQRANKHQVHNDHIILSMPAINLFGHHAFSLCASRDKISFQVHTVTFLGNRSHTSWSLLFLCPFTTVRPFSCA